MLFIHGDVKICALMCTQSCHQALAGLSFPNTHCDGDAGASSQIMHPCPPGAWVWRWSPSRPFGMEMGEKLSPPGAEPPLHCHPTSHGGG